MHCGIKLHDATWASSDIAVIDHATQRLIARIEVGKVPHQVAVSDRLGKLIASNTADNTVSIIDLATLRTEATLVLDNEPEHMELSPNGLVLAVGNIGAGTVSLISLEETREIARVDGLFAPHNLTFSADGSLLYVANLGAEHVSVVDVAEARVVNEIPVAEPTALAAKGSGTSEEYQGIINVTRTPDGPEKQVLECWLMVKVVQSSTSHRLWDWVVHAITRPHNR